MRERLFRGKRIDNEEWIEGYYITSPARTPCSIYDDFKREIEHFIISFTFFDMGRLRYLYSVKVKPETVGQYTGRIDCNGKKIFSGDMLELYPYSERWIVYWDEKELMYKIYSREGGDMPLSAIKNPTVVGTLWG